MNSFLQGEVKYAVYGGLQGGNANAMHAADVKDRLRDQLRAGGIVTINNDTMGGDPAPGTVKHFGAIVTVAGKDCAFACQEGQTIDFHVGGQAGAAPGVANALAGVVQGIVR